MNLREQQIEKFLAGYNLEKYRQELVSGDASFRKYQRVFLPDKSLILMDAPPTHEDVRPFIKIAESLLAKGFSAPEIIAQDVENGFLLLEDFGNDLFAKLLEQPLAAKKPDEEFLYKLALDNLLELEKHQAESDIPAYSPQVLKRELALYTDWYLPKIKNITLTENDKNNFLNLWDDCFALLEKTRQVVVLRDYHVSNMILLAGRDSHKKLGLLDFQDALVGHAAYDLVSLLEDARRDVSPEIAAKMLDYFTKNSAIASENKQEFLNAYDILGAQRNLKIIGIFTRLKYRDGKENYLKLLPRVFNYLWRDLENPKLAKIKDWLVKHDA